MNSKEKGSVSIGEETNGIKCSPQVPCIELKEHSN